MWRPTERVAVLVVAIQLNSEAEVAQLHLHLVIEQKVHKFQVSVDDALGSEEVEDLQNLLCKVLNLQLGQRAASEHHVVDRTVGHQVGQDIQVCFCVEEVPEAHDALVAEGLVDLDLVHEVLLGAALQL